MLFHGTPRGGGFYPRSAEEIRRDIETMDAIVRCLSKPKPRRPRLDDHQPWDDRTKTCARCGVSAVQFHANPNGIPCQVGR